MRVIQTDVDRLPRALTLAQGGDVIALPLDAPAQAWADVSRAGRQAAGWWQAARDPGAADAHPEWMHAPQHGEWLRRFPDVAIPHPALVWPYIGLGTVEPFRHALARLVEWASRAPVETIFLADIQGPPMGCGCGNPACRSWDNAPGDKVAPSAYDHPEILFPLRFFQAARALLPDRNLIPVLCPECERGIVLDGIDDPDGPLGTDLCQGVLCMSPCTRVFFPRLLEAFRAETERVALVLMVDALRKNHPLFGAPRAWAERAWRHYGTDLMPLVEVDDASLSPAALIALAYDQSVSPHAPPPGYVPSVPTIPCGGCPS
mgnify:CR=1 FL=1